jgi:P27 family predicted phage terminase small subunit
MPQRRPDALKVVSGTARRDRLPRSDPSGRLLKPPRPPAHVSELAASEWRRLAADLVESRVLATGDLRGLELLCQALVLESEMRSIIAAEGATISTAEGGRKAHPALKAAMEARAQAIRLMQEFGLTPSSRQRVDRSAVPAASDTSPWARLKALQGAKAAG